jgi:hypothetical protein
MSSEIQKDVQKVQFTSSPRNELRFCTKVRAPLNTPERVMAIDAEATAIER